MGGQRDSGEDGGGHEHALRPGDSVGKFVIEAQIGEGGFGTVYRAKNDIDKVGAVKVLHRMYSADPDMVSRFKAEARAVNQIGHRGIIDIFEFGALPDGRQYYVMEYLAGMPMDEFLNGRGPVPIEEALPIMRGVAAALDAAHEKGIAHRDLKPENIFLAGSRETGFEAKLLDFGIAKLLRNEGGVSSHKTRTGAPIGTPYYMSPEQCRGRNVDHRTDLYAFGCVLYEMVAGRVPFEGEDVMDILLAQIQEVAKPPSALCSNIDPAVDQTVAWLMQKDPEARPPNLAAAIEVLDRIRAAPASMLGPAIAVPARNSKNFDAGTAETMYREDLPPRSRGAVWATVAGLGVAVAAALAVLTSNGDDAVHTEAPPRVAREMSLAPAATPNPRAEAPPIIVPPAAPTLVTYEISGVPDGTEVAWPHGPLGVAPGAVQIPYGIEPVTITLHREGYRTVVKTVTPNADGALDLRMVRKERTRPRRKPRGNKHDRNSTENPFD